MPGTLVIVAGETIDEVNDETPPLLVDGDTSSESIEPKLLTSELAPALALVAAGAVLVRGAGERERRKPVLRAPRRPRRGQPWPREIDHLHAVLREDELAPEVEMHHEEACDLLFDQALAAWSERDAGADARETALRHLREELPPLPDASRSARCTAPPMPAIAIRAQRRRTDREPLNSVTARQVTDVATFDDAEQAAVAAFTTSRRSKRLAAICVTLAILFCWFGLPALRNAESPTSATPNTASAAATSRGELRQVSHTSGPPAKRIEDIQLGDRVAGRNPHREEVELVEPDEETWREVRLRLKKEDGGLLWINLLRPVEWLEIQEAQAGGEIFLDLPEMGAVGDATVLEVLPCPKIDYGHGAVVTGQFRHEVVGGEIVELRLDGQATSTRVTANHPYWSVDRDDFVPAGELKTGEQLDTLDGDAKIASVTRVPYSGLLYNLETTEHVYRVDAFAALVHNQYADTIKDALRSGAIRVATKVRAGITRLPRHHIFPQEHAGWFAARGIEVGRFTVPLQQGVHSALHSMKWSPKMMATLLGREASLGRQLTSREIWQIGFRQLRQFNIRDVAIIPYVD